ncbi:MAG: hypothetical protein ACPGC9_00340, partial [Cytophagales bacterium]
GLIVAGDLGYQQAQETKKHTRLRQQQIEAKRALAWQQERGKIAKRQAKEQAIRKAFLQQPHFTPFRVSLEGFAQYKQAVNQTLRRIAYLEQHYQIGVGDQKADRLTIGAMMLLQWYIDEAQRWQQWANSMSPKDHFGLEWHYCYPPEVRKASELLPPQAKRLERKLHRLQDQLGIERASTSDYIQGAIVGSFKATAELVAIGGLFALCPPAGMLYVGVQTLRAATGIVQACMADQEKERMDNLYRRVCFPRAYAQKNGEICGQFITICAFTVYSSFSLVEEGVEIVTIAEEAPTVAGETQAATATKAHTVVMAEEAAVSETSTVVMAEEAAVVQKTKPTLRPEAKYLGSKKHGIHWKEGLAEAKNQGRPQGQWGSQKDLDFAAHKASNLPPKKFEIFKLPPDHTSSVHFPDGKTVKATHINVSNNGTGTFHGYPIFKK